MVLPTLLALKDFASVMFGGVNNKTKQRIYETGFFFSSGVLGGVVMNDIMRLLNVSKEHTPVTTPYGIQQSGPRMDELIQNGIAAAIFLGGIILNKPDMIAFSAGNFLGISWANRSERGEYIGVT